MSINELSERLTKVEGMPILQGTDISSRLDILELMIDTSTVGAEPKPMNDIIKRIENIEKIQTQPQIMNIPDTRIKTLEDRIQLLENGYIDLMKDTLKLKKITKK